MMGVLGLLGVFLVIAAVTPQGNSEAATFVTSARAPDIVTQGPVSGLVILAVVVAVFTILAIAVTLVLFTKRSTLKWKTFSSLRLSTMNFLSRIHYTASGDADVGHRQPRRTFRQFLDDLGLGSHMYARSVRFPWLTNHPS
jgi:hypothetical protein